MRFYAIKISASQDSSGLGSSVPAALTALPGAGISGAQYCSVQNGVNNPGALNVEMDLFVRDETAVTGHNNWVRIWGIPLSQIAQSSKLFGCTVEVYGGMAEGLPLANIQVPHQGLLCKGTIKTAFGNWVGTDMTLDLMVTAGPPGTTGAPNNPKNIVHNWQANTPLSQSIDKTLKQAFPTMKRDIQISPNLKLAYPDIGFYNSLGQFANYIRSISFSILGTPNSSSKYKGVSTWVQGDTIKVSDGTQQSSGSKSISIYDLIGQPVWVQRNVISVKTIMRADIKAGDTVTLPQTPITTSLGGAWTNDPENIGGSLTFTGEFQITEVRHVGNFRQNDSASWVTILTGNTQGQSGSNNAPSSGLQTSAIAGKVAGPV
jgi:hypothetical protein